MSKYLGFFKVCNNLKIFDLKTIKKIITNKNLAKNIYSRKKSKIEKTFRRSYIQDISIKGIEKKLQAFFYEKPQLIKPKMVTTISVGSFAKYYLQILLFYTPEVLDIIEEIKDYFPRLLYSIGDSLFNQGKWLKIHIWLPNLRDSEKNDLISILFNKLKDYLISIQRYYFDGLFPAYSRKDFYDFEKMEFFYSKTLYKEYFIFVQNIIQRKLPYFHEKKGDLKGFFWNSINDLNRLVQQVEKRISYEQIDYDLQLLTELISLNSSLINSLLDIEGFKILKNSTFFKKYIKSIKFKPVFQKFGFNQYFLYIRPSNLEDFDFKLILSNNFQNIKYPASVDNFQTFFIKYIFPYRTPNTSYLNWMSKSKKNIDEYCLFFIKKIYQIFHFDYNISSSGWLLNANRFKSFMQKVLYDPNFKIQKLNIKEFNIGDQIDSVRYNFNSKEFNSLTQIYNWHSTDIKSVLGTKMFSKVNSITSLIEKKLIFPYLKMKNLGLYEKIYIIIPNTNKENIDKLVKIFNFFNFGFIYEIEGSYFIKGMEEEIGFNNGLFIKLYFPDIDLSSFFRLFDLLFQFLKIKKYLILNDMSDGKSLLNHIYGNLDFLKNYNPLKNLLYNEKDEKYMNTKLYNESFEPKYPELI